MLLSHLLFLSLMCVTVNGLGEVRGTFTCRRNSEAEATTPQADAPTTKVGATTPQAGTTTTKAGTTTNQAGATTNKAEATTTNVEATTTKAGTTTTRAGATTSKAGATTNQAEATTTNVEATTTKAGATTTKAGATTTNVEATTTKASTNYNGTCSSMSIIDGSLTDCKAIYTAGCNKSGIYNITPNGWTEGPFEAYCDMDTVTVLNSNKKCTGRGWTVFQRRVNGSVDFNRNWASYKDGFGQLDNEFWLGNEKLHYLTNGDGKYRLQINLVSSSGDSYYACYNDFHIEDDVEQYKLHVSGVHGTNNFDVFHQQRSKKFSASGTDNRSGGSDECNALMGGWWHRKCSCSSGPPEISLNGHYSSLQWDAQPSVGRVSINSTEMKIRPE